MSIHWGGRGAGHISRWSAAPTGVPSLMLDFLTTTSLDRRITFSRASQATLVDSTGKITYAPNNLLTYSEEFNNAAWSNINAIITANTTVSPDGTNTADTITEAATASQHGVSRVVTTTANTSYATSVYAKANGRRYLSIATGSANGVVATFDLQAGVISAAAVVLGTGWINPSATITSAGNGWYRCTVVGTDTVGSGRTFAYTLNNAATNPASGSGQTYTGDGTSGIFLWGAQLEAVTYQTNPSAYVQTVASAYYGPRFDYDPVTLAPKGLLIEEQRTNLLTYSEQFNDVAWVKTRASIAANSTTAPDGTNNADTLIEDTTAASTHFIGRVVSANASTAYTQSIFLKAAGRTRGQLQMFGNGGGSTVNFDLTAVTATATGGYGGWTAASATITHVGGGWYRLTHTVTTNAGLTAFNNNFYLADAAGNASYTGDGTSGMFLYGAQVEAGAFATSYIPTVASQVTRSADNATMTGTNFSNWYNQSAGTMVCNFAMVGLAPSGTSDVWIVNDGTSSNNIRLRQGTVIAGADATMITGGVTQVDSNSIAVPVNTLIKTAFAWSTTSSNLTSNGTSLGNGGSITPPAVNQLILTGGSKWLRGLAFYNTRLPNTTLQVLTS